MHNGRSLIKMNDQEIVEDEKTVRSIANKCITNKCTVINVDHRECVATALNRQKHKETRENHDIYICRYKLIKQTTYILMPVSWKVGDIDERRERPRSREPKNIQCTDEQSENAVDEPFAGNNNEPMNDERRVTPIKIINNSVQKMKRLSTPERSSPPKRSSPSNNETAENDYAGIDDGIDVSPTKRSKRENETSGNYLTASPATSRKMSVLSARKNLEDSFSNSPANESDLNGSAVDRPPFEVSELKELRMTLKVSDSRRYV